MAVFKYFSNQDDLEKTKTRQNLYSSRTIFLKSAVPL